MNLVCPSAQFFYLWSILYPPHFSVPAFYPLLDYFETSTEMCGKNFFLYGDILEDITVRHIESKGEMRSIFILKEKVEERREVKLEQ